MTSRPSASSLQRSAHGAADRATNNKGFEYTARIGFAASGVLHLLLAYIVLRIALGAGGNADQSGALAALGSQTGGMFLLWAVAIGLAALGLWRIAEAVIGSKPGEQSGGQDDNGWWKRAKSVGLAIASFGIAVSAARYAMGSGQSDSRQNAGLSAQLMQSGGGKALLIVVGLVVLAIGGYHVYKGISQKFLDELQVSGGTAIVATGVAGYTAKGLVLGGAGILVIVATLQADPAKASGLDAAIKTLGQAPFGKFLLILAALGLAAFGAYSFVRSRYNRM